MNELLSILPAFFAGAALGIFYFGGLWLTVQRIPAAQRPVLSSLASFLVRSGAVLAGFYLIGLGDWVRLPVALLGFILVRMVILFKVRSGINEQAKTSGTQS